MKIIKLNYNQNTGEIFEINKIPEVVQAKISSFYLHTKRNNKLTPEKRSEIAKKAASASAKVRSEKARMGTLKKYVRKNRI